jgi:RsiW-degrading membrane proteinase PrsW (M82 family)
VIVAFVIAVFLVSICVFFYGLAIKSADRYEPEPWYLLVMCFLWGALGATFFSLILNTIGGIVIVEAINPHSAQDAAIAHGLTASWWRRWWKSPSRIF